MRTTFSGALEHYADHSPKGEYVLVVEGYTPPQPVQVALEAVSYTHLGGEEGGQAAGKPDAPPKALGAAPVFPVDEGGGGLDAAAALPPRLGEAVALSLIHI